MQAMSAVHSSRRAWVAKPWQPNFVLPGTLTRVWSHAALVCSQDWQATLTSGGVTAMVWQVASQVAVPGGSQSSPAWMKPSPQTGGTFWQVALQKPARG